MSMGDRDLSIRSLDPLAPLAPGGTYLVNGRVIRFDDSSYDSTLLKMLMTL